MRRRILCWVLLAVASARSAAAQSGGEPAIWYRASENCPSGPEFLEKVAIGHARGRLAGAGDHIDFVVTLLSTGGDTLGRLERQTNAGTVAIRELRDSACDRVAEALALSLGLALNPAESHTGPVRDPKAIDDAEARESELRSEIDNGSVPEASSLPSAAQPPLTVAIAARAPNRLRSVGDPTDTEAARRRWFVGLSAGPMIGISTEPMSRGEVFLGWHPALEHLVSDLALRLGLVGAVGSSNTAIGAIKRWILAARGQACPVRWGNLRFDVRPCLAVELGATGASGGSATQPEDRKVWAAPGVELRGTVTLVPRTVWLEAGGGAQAPLPRNEIFAGSRSLYRDASVVFQAGLGISLGLR